MKHLPDKVRWHIKEREKTSKEEAIYISQVINFFQKKLNEKYFSILDVACGNGRLHPYLRKFGFKVFGIDCSKELIKEAQREFPKYSQNYKQADMRNFDLKKKFDVALSWFTSFGYFKDKENILVLKNINKHLREKGLLLLDIPNGPVRVKEIQSHPIFLLRQGNFLEIVENKIENSGKQKFWVLKQTFYVIERKNFPTRMNVLLLKFLRKEKRRVRLYSLQEITKLLKQADFKVIEVFDSMSFNSINEKTRQMLVVAQKTS
jgi:SAM-dependent methyltransferase